MTKLKILAGTDFSDCSENAIRFGINMLANNDVQFIIAHCYSGFIDLAEISNPGENKISDRDKVDWQKRQKLLSFKSEADQYIAAKGKQNIHSESILLHGYAEDQLLKFAESENPDLVIIGSSAKQNPITELIGCVATDIIFKSNHPVLVVPNKPELYTQSHRDILFLTDFRSNEFESLHRLLKVFSNQNMTVHCVHARQSKPGKDDEQRMVELQNYCSETYRNHEFVCEILVGDNTIDSIRDYIVEKQICLIITTRVRHHRLKIFFHPDKIKQLLFHTQTAVLIFNA